MCNFCKDIKSGIARERVGNVLELREMCGTYRLLYNTSYGKTADLLEKVSYCPKCGRDLRGV